MSLTPAEQGRYALSLASASLKLGPVYRRDDERAWKAIELAGAALVDYLAVDYLELVIDTGEGYALLRGMDDPPPNQPRLVRHHKLSLQATCLLVLLRDMLHARDAGRDLDRLVLTEEELHQRASTFYPQGTSEVRIRNCITTLTDLGYLRRERGAAASPDRFEVMPVVMARVSADWVARWRDKLNAAVNSDKAGDDGSAPDTESSANVEYGDDAESGDGAEPFAATDQAARQATREQVQP